MFKGKKVWRVLGGDDRGAVGFVNRSNLLQASKYRERTPKRTVNLLLLTVHSLYAHAGSVLCQFTMSVQQVVVAPAMRAASTTVIPSQDLEKKSYVGLLLVPAAIVVGTAGPFWCGGDLICVAMSRIL